MSRKLNTIWTLSGSVLNSNSFWSKIFSGWLYLKNSHQHPSEPFLRCLSHSLQSLLLSLSHALVASWLVDQAGWVVISVCISSLITGLFLACLLSKMDTIPYYSIRSNTSFFAFLPWLCLSVLRCEASDLYLLFRLASTHSQQQSSSLGDS